MTTSKRDYAPWLAVAALVLSVLTALLTGCAAPVTRPVCPPLVKYTPQQEKALAAELAAHPELKEVRRVILDYGDERAECRAANKQD